MRARLFLIGIAVGLGWFAWSEWRLRRGAGSESRKVTCEQLGREGPGGNPWVEMGEFLLCVQHYCIVHEDNRWKHAYLPAVPLGGEYHRQLLALIEEKGEDAQVPPPKEFRVIVDLSRARSAGDVDRAAAQETLEGLVVNEVRSLGERELKILREGYPGVDLERAVLLQVGRRPVSPGAIFGLGGAALALLAFGILWRR